MTCSAFQADVVLLVTCSIREKAEERIWNKLRVLKKHKDAYHTSGYPKIGVLGKKKYLDRSHFAESSCQQIIK